MITKSTHKQAKNLIKNIRNTCYLKGEPGIGKTHLGKEIAEELDRPYIHLDVPQLNPEDISIPVPNLETKILESFPSQLLGLHLDKAPVIMLDELSKGEPPIINALHTILHPEHKYVAGRELSPDTIVICTGNLSSDGVGDGLQGHTIDRLVPIELRKSNNKEFIEWGILQGKDKRNPDRHVVHPWVIAWASREPEIFFSYTDLSEEELKSNKFIYNPRIHNGTGLSYVSPRGLVACTDTLYAYEEKLIDTATMNISLTGILGEAGGQELSSMSQLIEQVPTADEIRANPEGCKIPNDSAGLTAVSLGAPNWIEDRDDAKKWFTYMNRIEQSEFHSIFMMQASTNEDLKNLIVSTKEFMQWATDYKHLFDRSA